MDPAKPFLLVRARPTPEAADEFARWFRRVHAADVGRIPGFAAVEQAQTRGGAWLGIYTFTSAEAVQAALASPEAAYARGTWEQWTSRLEEMQVEIFAPVVPLPLHVLPN